MEYLYYKTAFAFLLFSSLVVFVSSCSTSLDDDHDHGNITFNYDEASGRGPSRWGTLKRQWRRCSNGRRQSPIDIESVRIRRDLGDLRQNYTAAPAVLMNLKYEVEMEWKLRNAGKLIIGRTEYKVVNVHWHSPSEHTINGTRYDLELHLVHADRHNKSAVVAILYKFGSPDPFLTKLMPSIPRLGAGENDIELGNLNPQEIGFVGRGYYRYIGSLTTPPCTEDVTWTILQQVKTVSREQVEGLKQVLLPENRNNSRPTQALNRRPVFLYRP